VNRQLEEKARALAGLKGYVTNLAAADPLPDDLRQALDRIHGRSSAH